MDVSKARLVTTITLFLVACILSLLTIFHNDRSLTTLVYRHIPETTETGHYLNQRKITGTIIAHDNFFGGVDFNINADIISASPMSFYFRERGATQWYYSNKFMVTSLNFKPLFPIGFPIITNSRGKTYEYIIVLDVGPESINKNTPLFLTNLITKYQYPKKELQRDKVLLLSFLTKKITVPLMYNNQLFLILLYFSPFIYFVGKEYFRTDIITLSIILMLLIILELYLYNYGSDIIYLSILAIWLHLCLTEKLDEKVSFLFSIFLILILAVNRISGTLGQADESAAWVYIFIVAGTVLLIVREKSQSSPKITISTYLKRIKNEILD